MLDFIKKPWVLISIAVIIVVALFFCYVRPSMMSADDRMQGELIAEHDMHDDMEKMMKKMKMMEKDMMMDKEMMKKMKMMEKNMMEMEKKMKMMEKSSG